MNSKKPVAKTPVFCAGLDGDLKGLAIRVAAVELDVNQRT
jgi:hypothetical protein